MRPATVATSVAFGLALASAGCLPFPDSAEVSGSGVTTSQETQTVQCGAAGATLDRYAAGGGGALQITVMDATGAPVYAAEADVAGELNDSRGIDGVGGTWRLEVKAEGFAGQFKITLSCP